MSSYAYRPHSEQAYQPAESCSSKVVWRPQCAHVRIWDSGKVALPERGTRVRARRSLVPTRRPNSVRFMLTSFPIQRRPRNRMTMVRLARDAGRAAGDLLHDRVATTLGYHLVDLGVLVVDRDREPRRVAAHGLVLRPGERRSARSRRHRCTRTRTRRSSSSSVDHAADVLDPLVAVARASLVPNLLVPPVVHAPTGSVSRYSVAVSSKIRRMCAGALTSRNFMPQSCTRCS